ncbi:MAG: hypothetical protein ABF289_12310 [Clostridiales bacterium]
MKKNSFLKFVFSFVPGAAHMYLGYMKLGSQLMLLFFTSIFLSTWISFSIFTIFIPLIWFYSFFDVLNRPNFYNKEKEDTLEFFDWIIDNLIKLKNKNKVLGIGLIVVGLYMIVEKIYVEFELYRYFQIELIRTGVIAVFLIGFGIRILRGKKEYDK